MQNWSNIFFFSLFSPTSLFLTHFSLDIKRKYLFCCFINLYSEYLFYFFFSERKKNENLYNNNRFQWKNKKEDNLKKKSSKNSFQFKSFNLFYRLQIWLLNENVILFFLTFKTQKREEKKIGCFLFLISI